MPEPMKHRLDADAVRRIADLVSATWPAFPSARFSEEATAGLAALELKARARHVGAALSRAFDEVGDDRALGILARALDAQPAGAPGLGFAGFAVSEYVESRAAADPEAALAAILALTKRFTGEFAIRPLLREHPERTFAELRRWAADPNEHVRRLVSEGTRPRLPWATRVPALLADPAPALALLETLRDDPSEYVRRSVANHLNDVAKDHPDVVVAVCRRWIRGATPERRTLVRHALRSLVKQGDARALAIVGAKGSDLRVTGSVAPSRVALGGSVRITAVVRNASRKASHVVVDARVHFLRRLTVGSSRGAKIRSVAGQGPAQKKRGTSVKVFKVGRADLAPGAEATVSKSFVLVHRSIRELHGGVHEVEVQVNGRIHAAGSFDLRVPAARPSRRR